MEAYKRTKRETEEIGGLERAGKRVEKVEQTPTHYDI